MIPCRKPGVYQNVPESEYHLWDATNQSLLTTVAKHGPKRARYEQLHQKDPTPAMQFGTRAHHFLLEPERIGELYVEPLDLPRRSNDQKATHAEYEAIHAGKEFVKPDAFRVHQEMADAMRARADWREMLENAVAKEVCVVWEDPDEGILMKARIDLVTRYKGTSCIVDYKTTTNASEWHFARSMWDYGYDIQAAHYLAAADSIATGKRTFVFAAQEKTPPYDAQMHTLGPISAESGVLRWQKAKRLWARCLADDEFPGYPIGLAQTEMPNYAINLMDEGESFAD